MKLYFIYLSLFLHQILVSHTFVRTAFPHRCRLSLPLIASSSGEFLPSGSAVFPSSGKSKALKAHPAATFLGPARIIAFAVAALQPTLGLWTALMSSPAFLVAHTIFFDVIVKLGFVKSASTLIPMNVGVPAISSLITILMILRHKRRRNAILGLGGNHPFNERAAEYDVSKLEEFYSKRPLMVLGRALRLASLAMTFNFHLFMDWQLGRVQKNEEKRADEAMRILAKMGPTFIKLGQALSIRTDIIPAAYAKSFKQLQDAVPAFDSSIAKEIVCQELEIAHLSERFRTFSARPVAAASIGQVYKATLLDGKEVAVKVQRPNILRGIGLDLFVMRKIVPIQVFVSNKINGMKTVPADIQMGYSLVDEWGKGLVAEMDYRLEACNTVGFKRMMQKRDLHAVISPEVVEELCTPKIMVTEWIEGTRLDRDTSADVPRLCGLALNAYLTMLLDTGVLHCDPHPGNLLRTQDGKLCILDWGMTLALPRDLQYSLLEFIAHCNAEDFSHLAEDFVKLGATPKDKIDEVRTSGIPEGFAFIMKQLSKGGGPAQLTDRLRTEFKERYGEMSDVELGMKARESMMHRAPLMDDLENVSGDVSGVTGVLEMMSKRNREIFKLPSYMLYVTRAFCTLEGIGLSIDPEYSILNECYPYLAKRLMTDNSPRSRKALRDMLYNDGRLSTERILEMTEGFTSYTASTADSDMTGEGTRKARAALTDLVLDKDGNMVQEVLLDGVTQLTDSAVRVGIHRLRRSRMGRMIKSFLKTPKTLVDMFVPRHMKAITLPLTLPYDVSRAVINLAEQDESDVANMKSVQVVWHNLQPGVQQQLRNIVMDNTVRRGEKRRERQQKELDDLNSKVFDREVIETYDITDADRKAQVLAKRQMRRSRFSPASVLVPFNLADSNRLRRSLGVASKFNSRIPVMMKMTRKLGSNMLSNAAVRLDKRKKEYRERARDHSEDVRYGMYLEGHEEMDQQSALEEGYDYEIELLLTESMGFVSSVAANGLSAALDWRGRREHRRQILEELDAADQL